ncbi:MAG: hypothetical protein QW348_02385 [Ignisphaera sp.]
MKSFDIPGIGKVTVEEVSTTSARVCADIADYVEVCIVLELKPLRSDAEKVVNELFRKYEGIVVEGFVKGLQNVVALIEAENRASRSINYM